MVLAFLTVSLDACGRLPLMLFRNLRATALTERIVALIVPNLMDGKLWSSSTVIGTVLTFQIFLLQGRAVIDFGNRQRDEVCVSIDEISSSPQE